MRLPPFRGTTSQSKSFGVHSYQHCKVCKNPDCKKRFNAGRGNQLYCSEDCRGHHQYILGREDPIKVEKHRERCKDWHARNREYKNEVSGYYSQIAYLKKAVEVLDNQMAVLQRRKEQYTEIIEELEAKLTSVKRGYPKKETKA